MVGWEMIQAVRQSSPLRCRWGTGDEACGRDPDVLDRIAEADLWYLAEVPHETRVWRPRPATARPAWAGKGRKPTRPRVVPGGGQPAEVAQLAASLPANRWVQRTIKAGSKGPLRALFARVRVMAVRESLPGPDVWLVLRYHVGTGELKTYVSHAPTETSLATWVRVCGLRWPIETCCEDGKQYLGMGAYEGRSWRGWHHHMTLVLLAHCFLVRMRLK
jgi:SRSO17 transposase